MAALNIPLSAAAPADSDGNLNALVQRAVRGGGLRGVMLEADDGAFVGALGFDHPLAELAWHLRTRITLRHAMPAQSPRRP